MPDAIESKNQEFEKDLRENEELFSGRLTNFTINKYIKYLGDKHPKLFVPEGIGELRPPYPLIVNLSNISDAKAIDEKILSDLKANELSVSSTVKKTIFAYPIHVSGDHWSLVLIDSEKRKIEYYDSYGGWRDGNTITKESVIHHFQQLASHLSEQEKGMPPYTFDFKTETKLQTNLIDCGPWALYCLEKRLENPDVVISPDVDMEASRKTMARNLTEANASRQQPAALASMPETTLAQAQEEPQTLTANQTQPASVLEQTAARVASAVITPELGEKNIEETLAEEPKLGSATEKKAAKDARKAAEVAENKAKTDAKIAEDTVEEAKRKLEEATIELKAITDNAKTVDEKEKKVAIDTENAAKKALAEATRAAEVIKLRVESTEAARKAAAREERKAKGETEDVKDYMDVVTKYITRKETSRAEKFNGLSPEKKEKWLKKGKAKPTFKNANSEALGDLAQLNPTPEAGTGAFNAKIDKTTPQSGTNAAFTIKPKHYPASIKDLVTTARKAAEAALRTTPPKFLTFTSHGFKEPANMKADLDKELAKINKMVQEEKNKLHPPALSADSPSVVARSTPPLPPSATARHSTTTAPSAVTPTQATASLTASSKTTADPTPSTPVLASASLMAKPMMPEPASRTSLMVTGKNTATPALTETKEIESDKQEITRLKEQILVIQQKIQEAPKPKAVLEVKTAAEKTIASPENYESTHNTLLEKEQKLVAELAELEKQLEESNKKLDSQIENLKGINPRK